ncbi:putative reverse transcriptase domain-containing protein, partial [Tanacetum coccineum]
PLPVPTSLPLPLSALPPLPVSLFIPPPVDRREDIPMAELPPRKRLCPTAPTSRYEVDPTETVEEVAPTTLEGVNAKVTELTAVQEQDTQDIYAVFEDAYMTHTQKDYRIASHESLMMTLIAHVSSLHGQLSAALGQIQTLQARDQTHADDLEGAAAAVEKLIEARVSATLANHDTLRNSTNFHGDESHNSDTRIRGTVRTPCEYTYKDFLNCKPLTFKGIEGVVVLSQWFEKMESVFHISNCVVENQVKFATCTFLGNALTWWNSHMKTVTQDVAYAMDWKALKKMMTVKYCPRSEIKKLEIELWNLKESEEVEKYVGGLPDMIRGNVVSYQPKTMEKEIELANDQMD